MRRAARGPAIAAWVLLGACTEPNPYLPATGASSTAGSETDPEPGPTSTTNTSSSGGTDDGTVSSGGESACTAEGMACVAAAPAGFAGPFAWLERPHDVRMACTAPFEEELVEAFSQISAPAAACACSCSDYSNGGCGSARLERHFTAACAGSATGIDLVAGCNVIAEPGWVPSSGFYFDAPVEGGCVPLPSHELAEAEFLTRHLACGGAPLGAGCPAGQVCAPLPGDPFYPRLCVWQEGDVACPAASVYGERTLLYRTIQDQRGCEQCTCSLPSACEGARARLSTDTDCNPLTEEVPPDGCEGNLGGTNIRSVLFEEGTPPRACEPAVVVPTGDAAGGEPLTFCCTR